MRASDYKKGKRIINKQTGDILEVTEINGAKVWEETKWGDIFMWVDGALYEPSGVCAGNGEADFLAHGPPHHG